MTCSRLKLPAQLSLTHGLLAHSALVCVPGRLVVVGVGNEASTHPEQREGLDLQVCCVSTGNDKKTNGSGSETSVMTNQENFFTI